LLQEAVAQELITPEDYELFDGVPVPVARGARSFHPGWLAEIARVGKGGNDRYFYGLHLLLVLSASGVATGWTLAAGNVQERWLAELLLSARAGCPQLVGPLDRKTGRPKLPAPEQWVGPVPRCGRARGRPIVSDRGFNGADWVTHWARAYGAQVIPKLGKRARRMDVTALPCAPTNLMHKIADTGSIPPRRQCSALGESRSAAGYTRPADV
jgi:hypothetical protein